MTRGQGEIHPVTHLPSNAKHSRHLVPLSIILITYLVIGFQYAALTPAWQVPDEPAHYNYVAQLSRGALPVLEMGDWDNTYLDAIKAAKEQANLLPSSSQVTSTSSGRFGRPHCWRSARTNASARFATFCASLPRYSRRALP
jgi:hypothetical protein